LSDPNLSIVTKPARPKTALKILVCVIPVAAAAVALFLKKHAADIAGHFRPCVFYLMFGKLCPACGNTRSVMSLLNGKIIESLGYNITPVVLLIFAGAFYVELAAYAFGKRLKIVPCGDMFLFTTISICLLYYLLRNFFPWLTIAY